MNVEIGYLSIALMFMVTAGCISPEENIRLSYGNRYIPSVLGYILIGLLWPLVILLFIFGKFVMGDE